MPNTHSLSPVSNDQIVPIVLRPVTFLSFRSHKIPQVVNATRYFIPLSYHSGPVPSGDGGFCFLLYFYSHKLPCFPDGKKFNYGGRLGLAGGVRERDDQAAGRLDRRSNGGRLVLLPKARPRMGDGLLHLQGISSAIHHWVCPAVHFHPAKCPLDPSRLPLHGHGGRVHGGATRETCPRREIHRGSFHPGRNGGDHGSPCRAERFPLHSSIHYPCCRDDGRERHDCHRCHHEKTPRRHQSSNNPGGNGVGAGGDATSGDSGAGEEGTGDRALAGSGQCQDGGIDLASGSDDRAYHGRGVAVGSHSAADCGYEYAHRSFNCQQHHVHLFLLACFLHQGLSAGDQSLCSGLNY